MMALNERDQTRTKTSGFLRAALHKLSQPLTAALWMNELQGDLAVDPAKLNIREELHRAAQMVRLLKELEEERQHSGVCRAVAVSELLQNKLESLKLAQPLAGKVARFTVSAGLRCWGDPRALDRTLSFLLAFLSQAAILNGMLEIAAHRRGGRRGGQRIEIRFTVPSNHGERLAAEFAAEAHPFEGTGYSFAGSELPEAALVQALVEKMDGSIAAEGSPTELTLVLNLQLADHSPKLVVRSTKPVRQGYA